MSQQLVINPRSIFITPLRNEINHAWANRHVRPYLHYVSASVSLTPTGHKTASVPPRGRQRLQQLDAADSSFGHMQRCDTNGIRNERNRNFGILLHHLILGYGRVCGWAGTSRLPRVSANKCTLYYSCERRQMSSGVIDF